MLIGVPKEIKNHEYRVGMTPTSVKEAVRNGHKVWVAGQCRCRHRRHRRRLHSSRRHHHRHG